MHCTKCGAEIPQAAHYCASCGNPASGASTTTVATFEPPPFRSEPPALIPVRAKGITGPAHYAGFWRRLVAYLIDGLILAVISTIVVMVIAAVALASDPPSAVVGAGYYVASWIAGWLYYALQHSSSAQATPGKRAMGIKVSTLTGERIGFGRATGRFLAMIASALTLGIGYAMAGLTRRKQALHDMMTGTLVVSRDTTPADIVAGLAEPRVSGGIIAIGIAAGLVPAVGILAAIAIPAYEDYLIRSQVSEGLTIAAEYKAAVAEALVAGTDYEMIDNDSIGLPAEVEGNYVSKIEVAGAAVQITYGGAAHTSLQEALVALIPGLNESGDVVWTCGYAAVPEGVTAYLEQHGDYTSVEPKYLPSACR